MVVRLRTAEGWIKKYDTIEGLGGGEGGPDKYVSNCGREWRNKPKPNEECDHLDCAIYLAQRKMEVGPEGFVLFIVLAAAVGIMILWGHGQDFGSALEIPGVLTLMAFFSLILGFSAEKQLKELTEYREKGTINRIEAFQIFEDQEVAKAKHWWQFW